MIMQTHTEAPTAALSTVLCWLVRGKDRERTYWRKLCLCGLYMLAMGLLIEACEGGIRKDYVTLSYLLSPEDWHSSPCSSSPSHATIITSDGSANRSSSSGATPWWPT